MRLENTGKSDREKYLDLLAEKYPEREDICREIINLSAIMNLPKGTEHFMSDLHGEYGAFLHILNNCSGVIKEKVDLLFGKTRSTQERRELCTLVYYPVEKLALMREQNGDRPLPDSWYRSTIVDLVALAKFLSSKYTRSKVRKAMPKDFAYILDELIHEQKDEDDNQLRYHEEIYNTILALKNGDEFIEALASLIKRLAVDHLHIVGDIYDRGGEADKIIDLLMDHHSIDIEWGNHDMLWMGAACGNRACCANVVRVNLKYHSTRILENRYGISLRPLTIFALKHYPATDPEEAALQAVYVLCQKLEGQEILRHPEYGMDHRLLLHRINFENSTIDLDGHLYSIDTALFPTLMTNVNPSGSTSGALAGNTAAGTPGLSAASSSGVRNSGIPTDRNEIAKYYELTPEEEELVSDLARDFATSIELHRHIGFLYDVGALYLVYNGNLLFHGAIPMDEDGNFRPLTIDGVRCQGRELYDMAEAKARRAFTDSATEDDIDFMWFLWGGENSPLCCRRLKTFERNYISEKETWAEETNPYDRLKNDPVICDRVLREFGLYEKYSHIINGHTPVRASAGERPVKADGRLIVIDGGFSNAYHKTTGIAGYTLIFNSHGLRLKAHQPFESVEAAIAGDKDIESDSEITWVAPERIFVKDTDIGAGIAEEISDLKRLLEREN